MPDMPHDFQDLVNAAAARARTDEAFRRELAEDPRRALGAAGAELSEADLEAVAGGSIYDDVSAFCDKVSDAVSALLQPAKF